MNVDLNPSNADYTVNKIKAHINDRLHMDSYPPLNENDITSSLNAPGCPAISDLADAIFATATVS